MLSAAAQKVYFNPNVSNEQSQRDFAACQLYAETGIPPATTTPPPNTGNKSYDTNCNVWGTTANCTTKEVVYQPTAEESLGYGLGTGFASGFARGFEVAKRTKLCMESKGYVQLKKMERTTTTDPYLNYYARALPELRKGHCPHNPEVMETDQNYTYHDNLMKAYWMEEVSKAKFVQAGIDRFPNQKPTYECIAENLPTRSAFSAY